MLVEVILLEKLFEILTGVHKIKFATPTTFKRKLGLVSFSALPFLHVSFVLSRGFVRTSGFFVVLGSFSSSVKVIHMCERPIFNFFLAFLCNSHSMLLSIVSFIYLFVFWGEGNNGNKRASYLVLHVLCIIKLQSLPLSGKRLL